MINQNWALLAIHNNFSGHVFVGFADATDVKIGRMVGYAGRTARETVVCALRWRRKISDAGFTSVDAFPGDNGEILISGIQNNLEFEIIVEDNQALTVTLSSDDTVLRDVACGSFDEADSVLTEAAVRVWTSSGGLRLTNSTGERSVSQASHSENRRATVACLW